MTKRPYRHNDGFYHIKGKKYLNLVGSRRMVFTFGTAYKTRGNVTKEGLMKNKVGDIVSKKKHFSAKKEKRLLKSGYGTRKGKFGWVKVKPLRGRITRRARRMRGGAGGPEGAPAAGPLTGGLSPSNAVLENNLKSGPAAV